MARKKGQRSVEWPEVSEVTRGQCSGRVQMKILFHFGSSLLSVFPSSHTLRPRSRTLLLLRIFGLGFCKTFALSSDRHSTKVMYIIQTSRDQNRTSCISPQVFHWKDGSFTNRFLTPLLASLATLSIPNISHLAVWLPNYFTLGTDFDWSFIWIFTWNRFRPRAWVSANSCFGSIFGHCWNLKITNKGTIQNVVLIFLGGGVRK